MDSDSFNLIDVKIPFKDELITGGVSVVNGKIEKVGKESKLIPLEKKIKCNGCILLPGLIDVHVHLRGMELSYKEDFYSGTCAAAAGGFTTVLDMPNTIPPTNSVERLREKIEKANKEIVVNVGFHAAFIKDFQEILNLRREGAFSLKLYLANPIVEIDVNDDETMVDSFMNCAKAGVLITIHAEDRNRIEELKKHYRTDDILSIVKTRPPKVEYEAVKKMIEFSKISKASIHFCHISSMRSIECIKKAKIEGVDVSCEVSPHHLFLDQGTIKNLEGLAFSVPPLRSKITSLMLMRALKKDEVDMVASDHAPHAFYEKINEDPKKISPGFPGLETTLPILLNEVNKGNLTLGQIVKFLAKNPAIRFGIKSKGSLEEGNDADMILVDLKKEFKIDSSKFYSKAKYSPFNGFIGNGRVVKTFVNGVLVMDDGEIVADKGIGKIVKSDWTDEVPD
ncbi:MAG: dihydroorotase family protein [Candidatus Bathyarchaeia archaeon]